MTCSLICPRGEETRSPKETRQANAESAHQNPHEHHAPGSQNCRPPRRSRRSGGRSAKRPGRSLCSVLCPRGDRRRTGSRGDPRSRCKIRLPLVTRAQGSEHPKNCRLNRTPECPGSRSPGSPYARLKWENGRERAKLPYLQMDANARWLHPRARLTHGLFCLGPRGTESLNPTLLCSDTLLERKEKPEAPTGS